MSEVAEEIFGTLLRLSRTKEALLQAVVVGFERSESYKAARQNIGLLEQAHNIPESLWRRIEIAVRSNEQVAKSSGVADRVAKLVGRVRA